MKIYASASPTELRHTTLAGSRRLESISFAGFTVSEPPQPDTKLSAAPAPHS